jgi:signal transduction histidine kinase
MSVAARTGVEVVQKGETTTFWDNLGMGLSAAALLAAAIGILYTIIVAIGWYQQPFLGVVLSYDLKVTNTQPLGQGDDSVWPALKAGLAPNDQLLRIGTLQGSAFTPLFELADSTTYTPKPNAPFIFNQALAQLTDSPTITVEIFRPTIYKSSKPAQCSIVLADGAICYYTFPMRTIPLIDFLAQFGVSLLLGSLLLAIGVVAWGMRRRQASARAMAIICASAAFAVVARFNLITSFTLVLAWAFAMCVLAGGLTELALIFPFQPVWVRRNPLIRFVPALLTLLAFGVCVSYYVITDVQSFNLVQGIATAAASICGILLLGSLYFRRRSSISPMTRDQSGIVLVGLVVAILPTLIWFLLVNLEHIWGIASITFTTIFILPPLLIFPLSLAYAILQYRLVNSDRVISEAMIYFTLGFILILGYLLVTDAVYTFTNGVFRFDSPFIIAVTLFIISVAFTPARLRMERLVQNAFFRQSPVYEQRLEQYSHALPTVVEIDDIVEKFNQLMSETILPQYSFTFLRNVAINDYEAYVDPQTGRAQTDIRFDGASPLVRLLETSNDLLYLGPGEAPPPELSTDRARILVLNTPVIVRLHSAARLNGFVALGPRRNNLPYHYEDLRYLERVTAQTAAAVERAQVIVEARRNEVELKVLAQISAALNIAMDFDTLLEFVYTQVDKVIRAPNFYIVLRDPINEELYYAFFQEDEERISDKEGIRWTMGRDLYSEVIRSGQPYKTENFVQEQTKRESRGLVDNLALRAWMCVPLNAGTGGALGALALGTTDANIVYTTDQVRIFSNIADLAATALYKTRLFSEAEKRARQMKVLNDISSRLASEFENIEALLRIIIESSVEMLSGEAGSLLLVDESSGDLIFRLAVGGSGQELVGTRIPKGSGIAGTVVNTARHVIVNDAHQDRRWFGEVRNEIDRNTRRFATRSILAVPLAARGGVLGVIEVINKKDGSPFVDDDVNLLTTFASQGAIAIENARLFQMTDLALTERVQQMDTMGKIDQELNRRLNLDMVIELTIGYALKESNADSGVLALVEDEQAPEFVIANSIGYPEGMFAAGQKHPIDFGILGKVFRTGQFALISNEEMSSDRDYVVMLPDAKGQLAVPMITGRNVTAVLLLESTKPEGFNMMTASFTQSLAEHANTAITNAQLFKQLESANEARLKFVAFVAHELKNPMTSIKGYAEVLLGGMMGPISEQQQHFIAVIRSNVVRMQNIVEDLRDLTAQESGKLTLKFSTVSFNNVILETLRPQQRAIDEKGQKVVLNVPENLPPVWGDEQRLIQVLTNFVSNANKYTPPNGTIVITAEDVPNIWDETGAKRVIHCAIADTGIGMSDTDLRKLFTAYWRSDNPRAQEQPGTGLGMTLTRGLVESHGGKVWVESIIDVGTTFHMTVPLVSEVEKAVR